MINKTILFVLGILLFTGCRTHSFASMDYVVALPLEWIIGTYFDFGAVGVWFALAVGLTLSAAAMTWRFYRRLAVMAR